MLGGAVCVLCAVCCVLNQNIAGLRPNVQQRQCSAERLVETPKVGISRVCVKASRDYIVFASAAHPASLGSVRPRAEHTSQHRRGGGRGGEWGHLTSIAGGGEGPAVHIEPEKGIFEEKQACVQKKEKKEWLKTGPA